MLDLELLDLVRAVCRIIHALSVTCNPGSTLYTLDIVASMFAYPSPCRSLLFWDIRPPVQKKTNEANRAKGAAAANQPFSYLDLTWKPFLKVRTWV